MKGVFGWLGTLSLLAALVGAVGVWWYQSSPRPALISPVLGLTKIRYSDNIWVPQEASPSSFADAPEVSAESAFFVEANSGQILYSKNQDEQLRIASLIKIMTAIIALENKGYQDTFIVSKRASEMEPDEMILLPGEKMTLEELLSGIFLVSANDAAEVLAEETTGIKDELASNEEGSLARRAEFIEMMNTKAKVLGMNNSLFINPTGLEEDEREHYSTAYDVALMSRYLVARWPQITAITSSPQIYLPRTENHQDYDMYSGINLLTTYPGVLGLKTGYTPEAGLTLVTLAQRSDTEVIGVLLNSVNRRDDARLLLDYSFQKLGL